MKAALLYRNKKTLESGAIIEMVIWRLPRSTADQPHGYKYRLYYGRAGRRIVGYDNERGKGDHRHYRETEAPYPFTSIEELLADFHADVTREEAGI